MEYDKLHQQFYKTLWEINSLKQSLFHERLEKERLLKQVEDLQIKIERIEQRQKEKDEEQVNIYFPEMNLKQIEAVLKMENSKWIIRQIIQYLKLDSFEFVKWIAGVANKNNVSEVLAYRDGALQRNESLIRFLEKFAKEDNLKLDRLKGEIIERKI